MDSFFDNLKQLSRTSPEAVHLLKSHVVKRVIQKGAIVQHEGDTAIKGYYVRSGLLRSYTIDDKGKAHIFMFAPEGWVVGDMESQVNDSPAVLFIDALEDSEVEVFDNKAIEGFIRNMPDERLMNEIKRLMKRISVLQKRVIMLMSATAGERYQEFLKTYPNIVQRVPQKMIASYLGITPEALSKIRGDIVKEK